MAVKSFFLIGALFWYSAGVWHLINDYFRNEFRTKMADDLKRAIEIQPPSSVLEVQQTNILPDEISKHTVLLSDDYEKGNYDSNTIIKNVQSPDNIEKHLLVTSLYRNFESDSSSNTDIKYNYKDLKCQNTNVCGAFYKTVLGVNDCHIKKNYFICKNDKTTTTITTADAAISSRDNNFVNTITTTVATTNNKIDCTANTGTNVILAINSKRGVNKL